MTDQSRNAVLLGKIVSWPNEGDGEDSAPQFAGRGEIAALLDGPFLLVRHIPRGGDPEPPHMMILSMCDPGLKFYNTLAQEEAWYAWICNDPEPIATLVKR